MRTRVTYQYPWSLRLASWLLFLALGFGSAVTHSAQAWHIAGAQLRYDCLGTTPDGQFRYRLELTLFRDCSVDNDQSIPNAADYDDLIYIFIYQADTRERQRLVEIPQPADTPRIAPNEIEACIAIPPSICMQEGTYIREISLPPRQGGWHVAWGRCCRNQTIKNLIESRLQGINYLAFIPGPESAPCNSMSRFSKRPPLFICRGVETAIDFSATDLNGDSLAYRLSHPYSGLNIENIGVTSANPAVGIFGNRFSNLGAPPYQNVRYVAGYTYELPFGVGSPCRIDERTGMLYVTPAEEGIYVVAVSVYEYRNGQLLAENKFDIQIQVIPCQPKGRPPVLVHQLAENQQRGAEVVGDTLFVDFDEKPCFRFRATDPDPESFLRFRVPEQPVEGIKFRITLGNPAYIELCMDELCAYAGQLLALPMEVIDSSACPVQFRARDTAYIRVRHPPEFRPRLQARAIGNPQRSADTLLVRFGETICFDFELTPNGGLIDRLAFEWRFTPAVARSNVSVTIDTGSSGIRGKLCWVTDCEGVKQPVRLDLIGAYNNICAPQYIERHSFFVSVIQPTQPRQRIINLLDRSLIPTEGDTVLIPVDSSLCYTIQALDTNPWYRNVLTAWIETIGGQRLDEPLELEIRNFPLSPSATDYETVIEADLCWRVSCAALGQAVRIIVRVDDYSVCTVEWVDYDTIWVRAVQPANHPPKLSLGWIEPVQHDSTGAVVVVADSELCARFEIQDPAADGRLFWQIELVDEAGQPIKVEPSITFLDRNEPHYVRGRICFRPGCDLLGRLLALRFTGTDSNRCTVDYLLTRHLTFRVVQRPTFPPRLQWFAGTRPRQGDTLVFYPKVSNCIRLQLTDSLNTGYVNQLKLEASGEPTQESPPASLNPIIGVNRIESQFCWQPNCSQLGRIIPVDFLGISEPGCSEKQQITLRIWIRIEELPNQPPSVTLDASMLPDPLVPGKRYCLEAVVNDPDTFALLVAQALSATAEPEYGFGSGLEVRLVGSNPDRYTLCFTPNCHLRNTNYPVHFCAEDQTNCTQTLDDCQSIELRIQDCGLTMPNVFTPNGDGVNDLFLPIDLEGIRTYELHIYDRTGKLVFRGTHPEAWDGLVEGRPAIEGVYFYRLRYERESGTGPRLLGERTGHLTLLR